MKAMKKTTKKEGGAIPPPSPSKFTPCGEGKREGVCKQLGIQTTENISHAFMTPEGSADYMICYILYKIDWFRTVLIID